MGNFTFLKRKIVTVDHYGAGVKRLDWPGFQSAFIQLFQSAGRVPSVLKIEHQHLWNFEMAFDFRDDGTVTIKSTGFHTHGMKKGKQIDPQLIVNLEAMGMTPPHDTEKSWEIALTKAESEDDSFCKIVTHILERGYEFNPNLIQSVELVTD